MTYTMETKKIILTIVAIMASIVFFTTFIILTLSIYEGVFNRMIAYIFFACILSFAIALFAMVYRQ